LQIPIGLCADRFNLRWLYAAHSSFGPLAQGLNRIRDVARHVNRVRMLLGIGESIYLVGGTKVVSLLPAF
jgi:hypothetical protein